MSLSDIGVDPRGFCVSPCAYHWSTGFCVSGILRTGRLKGGKRGLQHHEAVFVENKLQQVILHRKPMLNRGLFRNGPVLPRLVIETGLGLVTCFW